MSLRPGKVDFGRTWAGLSSTITAVLTLKPVPRTEWNDRFADVYSLCVAHPQPLADKLYQELKRLLTKHVVEWRTALSTVKGPDLLNSYHGAWEIYNVAMGYLNLLFRYLNQQHIAKSKSCELPYNNEYASRKDRQLEIGELGMELWKREVILPLEQKLITQLLSGFASAAKGSGVDRAVASTVNSLVAVQQYCIPEEQLDLYQRLFEKRLLEARGDFYKWCAVSLLKDDDVFQYFPAVNSFLQKEMDLASRLLHPTSVPRLRQRCETHLIAEHLPRLQAACCEMVRKEDSKGLSIAYPLLRPIPAGITCLRDELGEQIKQQGLATCWPQSGTPPTPTEFVDSVLSMLQRYQNLVSIAFQNDSAFTSTLDRAMARVVNHRPAPNTPPPAAELLVRFCNGILCHSKGDMETENELGRAVKVFKYLDDKDVFQKFYARRLARRLIFQQNLSMESEECMINLLKQVCGWEFTSKFHRMFLDISLSIDLCQKFESSQKDKALPGGPSFSVQVLQAGAWPLVSTQLTPFSSPHDLEQHLHSFGSFYRSLHSGRKLTWLYHLFSGEVRVGYLKKPYVVTMQAFQIAILLLFETTDIIPCVKAREMLQLNEDQFYRHAASLVEAKLLILSEAADIKDTGAALKLNTNFSNKRVKFRLPVVNQRDPPEETKQTLSSVDEDRKMYLQAAIVRIMKSRKILRHTSLVQEVLSQSASASFTPTVNLIKTCIEALIDKQYLERSQHSTDEYSYVA